LISKEGKEEIIYHGGRKRRKKKRKICILNIIREKGEKCVF